MHFDCFLGRKLDLPSISAYSHLWMYDVRVHRLHGVVNGDLYVVGNSSSQGRHQAQSTGDQGNCTQIEKKLDDMHVTPLTRRRY